MNDIVCISPIDGVEVARRRPANPWTGVKDTGRGASMGPFGFEAVTRLKSFHLRLEH